MCMHVSSAVEDNANVGRVRSSDDLSGPASGRGLLYLYH